MPCLLWYLFNDGDLRFLLVDSLGYEDDVQEAADDWNVMDDYLRELCSDKKVIKSYIAINNAYESSIDKVHHKINKQDKSTHESYLRIMLNLLIKIFMPDTEYGIEAPHAQEYFDYWKEVHED